MPTLFIAVSLISVTMAWFAYSGLTSTDVDIGVKAWNIKITRNSNPESSDITVSFTNIHPGMDIQTDTISIKNLGDSDAQLKYSIVSARIMGDPKNNFVVDDNTTTTSEYVDDVLSHNYPFHINMNLSKDFVSAKNNDTIDESIFQVSVSWPLDSGNNGDDSYWGTEAYNYTEGSPIEIVVSITAEQYIEEENSGDINYPIGKEVFYDVISNSECSTGSTCLKTNIIGVKNTENEEIISLLPDVTNKYESSTYDNYITSFNTITNGWYVNTRELSIDDILNIVSTDIMNSVIVRDNLSNAVIGNLKYQDRFNIELNKIISNDNYFMFSNNKFDYLVSSECYWIKMSNSDINVFSAERIVDTNTSKIFENSKTNRCKVIPVIEKVINKTS